MSALESAKANTATCRYFAGMASTISLPSNLLSSTKDFDGAAVRMQIETQYIPAGRNILQVQTRVRLASMFGAEFCIRFVDHVAEAGRS